MSIFSSVLTQENQGNYPVSLGNIVEFLYTHLDEFRDSRSAISNAIDYALSAPNREKGFVLGAFSQEGNDPSALIGLVVMNATGMSGYVPPNFLVYIAVHRDFRGKGLGKTLLTEVFAQTSGSISLHVEYNNPAKGLYEKLGFTSKYAEMRWEAPTNG
ncbi:MAG: GNAT family N-acetyltransferase [Spirochaetales bacterium]|nr:GNAT family N-acetyltransferase [Spirochaetales bacterium]